MTTQTPNPVAGLLLTLTPAAGLSLDAAPVDWPGGAALVSVRCGSSPWPTGAEMVLEYAPVQHDGSHGDWQNGARFQADVSRHVSRIPPGRLRWHLSQDPGDPVARTWTVAVIKRPRRVKA